MANFQETLLSNVEVRPNNGQNDYGHWTPVLGAHPDDVPGWVAGLVADEIAENDADEGRVEQGGSIWSWRKAE